MTHLLVDTSVLIKWFHSDGEAELSEARAVQAAHVAGSVDAHVLDLALYEIGNVLSRALRWSAAEVADQLDDLEAMLGPPLGMTTTSLRRAAELAGRHSLSFYDASWAATAMEVGIPLITADRRLVAAGLAETPSTITTRLGLPSAERTSPPPQPTAVSASTSATMS